MSRLPLARTVLAAAMLAAVPALAADIVAASYDTGADAIFVEIAYRGTHAHHDFEVEWAPCRKGPPRQVAGRLLDVHGRDRAEKGFRVLARIALDRIPCRPAYATLRLGRVSHATVPVPAKPAQ